MAKVIEVRPGGPPIPADDDEAIYVWAGATGPVSGPLATYKSAEPSKTDFAHHEWAKVIDAAWDEAERFDIPTVFVVRNA